MKPSTLFALLLTCVTLDAQTVAVKFYGTNPQGLPVNWPRIVQPGTNAPAGFVLMTSAQLSTCISTNQAAYNAWESNKTFLAKQQLNDDFADLLNKLDKVETWIDKTSGTNTLTNTQRDNAINDISRAFKKLRPVLEQSTQQL